jgi:hypothetical protein
MAEATEEEVLTEAATANHIGAAASPILAINGACPAPVAAADAARRADTECRHGTRGHAAGAIVHATRRGSNHVTGAIAQTIRRGPNRAMAAIAQTIRRSPRHAAGAAARTNPL